MQSGKQPRTLKLFRKLQTRDEDLAAMDQRTDKDEEPGTKDVDYMDSLRPSYS